MWRPSRITGVLRMRAHPTMLTLKMKAMPTNGELLAMTFPFQKGLSFAEFFKI
jgi:hypothetical protein